MKSITLESIGAAVPYVFSDDGVTVFAAEDAELHPGETVEISTGYAVRMGRAFVVVDGVPEGQGPEGVKTQFDLIGPEGRRDLRIRCTAPSGGVIRIGDPIARLYLHRMVDGEIGERIPGGFCHD